MSQIRRWSLLVVVVASSSSAPVVLDAQGIPKRALTKPDVEFADPFTQIGGIRELKDGRVITIDSRDKVVQVLDLKSGAAEKIGREGSGPGEYALPTRLLALPGDSSAVVDPLNSRLLVITPAAKAGGFLELGGGPGAGRGGITVGINVNTTDARGRFYAQGSPFLRTADGAPQAVDSVAIERWERTGTRKDTLGFLQLPKGSTQISGGGGGGGGRVSMRIGGGTPFAPADVWAAAPDGRVALVHVNPYRVEFISASGTRTTGQPIAFERLKVTEAHKQQYRDQQKSSSGMMMTIGANGQRSAQTVSGANFPEPTEWPEYLPPFLNQAAQFSPDGTLWVRRTTPADDPPTFDLIDGTGRVTAQVTLPKKTRLVSFGAGTVYLARSDEDDLQYLQRYRFSMPDRP